MVERAAIARSEPLADSEGLFHVERLDCTDPVRVFRRRRNAQPNFLRYLLDCAKRDEILCAGVYNKRTNVR